MDSIDSEPTDKNDNFFSSCLHNVALFYVVLFNPCMVCAYFSKCHELDLERGNSPGACMLK